MTASLTKHKHSLCVISHFGERDRVTWVKTLPCSPKAAHVNHLLGPCQQPKGFNGTVFWDLHMSSVLFKKWKVSGGKERGETSLSVKLLKRRHGVRRENSCFCPFSLSPPTHKDANTHHQLLSPRCFLCTSVLATGLSIRWLNCWVPFLHCVFISQIRYLLQLGCNYHYTGFFVFIKAFHWKHNSCKTLSLTLKWFI